MLIQTKFMRDILASANECCNNTIKIFCPCKTEDLKQLVFFLYDGEIQCNSERECYDLFENLNKIFGFHCATFNTIVPKKNIKVK